MRNVRWIRTETPEVELWRQLGQYRYGPNVGRYLAEHSVVPAQGVADYVSGSIGQAEAYFNAAKVAPLDISPLLLYYGATSLLAGAAALMRGAPLLISNHGMAVDVAAGSVRMSDVEVIVRNTSGSGLELLSEVYGDSGSLPGQSRWTVGELLASLPDLKDDVQLCLPASPPHVLRLDTLYNGAVEVDRIMLSEFGTADPAATLASIVGFGGAYLPPQHVTGALILYRRLGGSPISIEALSGQAALLVGHYKGSCVCTPGQVLTMLMALFALGSVSRYNPVTWHPFVRTDPTGERLLVERFLALAARWLPNLVLSVVTRQWTRFTSLTIQPAQGLGALTRDDLRRMIQEIASDTLTSE